MINASGSDSLLAKFADDSIWTIFSELARDSELTRASILRPHDEARFSSDRESFAMLQRARLDRALGILTLFEIGFELGLFEREWEQLWKMRVRALVNLRKLARDSEAFFRYASGYLFFGARILSCRCFDLMLPKAGSPSGRKGDARNRRLFAICVPPPLLLTVDENGKRGSGIFEKFLKKRRDPRWRLALEFLDGFHPRPNAAKNTWREETKPAMEETAQLELWLRGLLLNATAEQTARFTKISDGLVAWVRTRIVFYLALQDTPFIAAGQTLYDPSELASSDSILTSPLTARFALADIYWIAKILRAEVSTNASVSYGRLSWLSLLSFKAVLEGKSSLYVNRLREAEEILRVIFGFACDLVQNGTALSVRRQMKYFTPEIFGDASACLDEGSPCTKEWRAVFDEELREIDRQRSLRTFAPPTFLEGEAFARNAEDADSYWSERLLSGRQPHDRIGLAFSGGGIRSATFNLGVLQGLQEFDLLRHIDYLSTVSGGGFIGSWLVGNVRRTRQWLGRGTCWDESIAHLRSYSSYLAPITGLLSADTWTLGASWVRNTFLIQLSGITWLFAVLLAALGARKVFLAFGNAQLNGFHFPWAWIRHEGVQLPYVGCVALLMGLILSATVISSFFGDSIETGKRAPSAALVRWTAVLPAWIGAFIVASILWSNAQSQVWTTPALVDHRSYSFVLKIAWKDFIFLLFTHWLALLCIGWFALKPAAVHGSHAGAATSANSRAPQTIPDGLWKRLRGRIEQRFAAAAPVRMRLWRSFWIGTLCVGALYPALSAILWLDIWWQKNICRFESYAFVFGPALVLGAFALSVVLFIGLSGRMSKEAEREWWTRFGAWLVIYAIAGFSLSAAAVFGPKLVLTLFSGTTHAWLKTVKWGAVASWLGTVVGGLFAGNSSKTAGDGSSKKLGLELLARAGGFAFVLGAVIAAATILFLFLKSLGSQKVQDYWQSLDNIGVPTILWVAGAIVLAGLLFSWFFEINIFGLSQFYRNRLVRCYLGATRWAPGIRKPHPFTKFDFNDDLPLNELREDFRGPFPIFNCTLNLGGSADLTIRSRHSASFSLTPLRCGADRLKVGYAPTGDPQSSGKDSFAGGVKLGQAVAISGAAASPNMGYNTSPLVALLLTMFNVRLGWWFPNPGRAEWKKRGLSFSLYYLSRELLGIADETRSFLNLSDGGHFENLGVYELVRRRCKVIIASDAECDESLQFGGLGNLIRICATDFGAVIDLDVRSIRQQRDGHSLAHCSVGRIKYSNGTIGYLIYLKASVTGDEDVGIAQYRAVRPSFPHESTANQFFSEDQFESYRKLGQHIVRQCLRGVQPGDHPLSVATKLADVMAPARMSGEAFLKHTKTLDRLWNDFRRAPALHSFVDELLGIHPPIAVVARLAHNAHQASEELCMALKLIQLMEDVYMDLQLDDFWEHPDNRGWAILFMRWARSPRFRTCWDQVHRTFGIRFEYFCEARLGLTRDTPIVRV